jgi:hypothetical protein
MVTQAPAIVACPDKKDELEILLERLVGANKFLFV